MGVDVTRRDSAGYIERQREEGATARAGKDRTNATHRPSLLEETHPSDCCGGQFRRPQVYRSAVAPLSQRAPARHLAPLTAPGARRQLQYRPGCRWSCRTCPYRSSTRWYTGKAPTRLATSATFPPSRACCIPALNLEDGPEGVADGMTGGDAAACGRQCRGHLGSVHVDHLREGDRQGTGRQRHHVDLGPTVNIVS